MQIEACQTLLNTLYFGYLNEWFLQKKSIQFNIHLDITLASNSMLVYIEGLMFKKFLMQFMNFCNNLVLIPVKPFLPSLMFAIKSPVTLGYASIIFHVLTLE